MTDQEVQQHLDTLYWDLRKFLGSCSEEQLVSIQEDLMTAIGSAIRARNAMRVAIARKHAQARRDSTSGGLRS